MAYGVPTDARRRRRPELAPVTIVTSRSSRSCSGSPGSARRRASGTSRRRSARRSPRRFDGRFVAASTARRHDGLRCRLGLRHARDYSGTRSPPPDRCRADAIMCPMDDAAARRADGRAADRRARRVGPARSSPRLRAVPRHLFVPAARAGSRPMKIAPLPIAEGPDDLAALHRRGHDRSARRPADRSSARDRHRVRLSDRDARAAWPPTWSPSSATPRSPRPPLRVLRGLGITTSEIVVGDGTEGWPEAAPFDRILVTAGAPAVPEPLKEQLADGRPAGDPGRAARAVQHLTVVDRLGERFVGPRRRGLCLRAADRPARLVGRHR